MGGARYVGLGRVAKAAARVVMDLLEWPKQRPSPDLIPPMVFDYRTDDGSEIHVQLRNWIEDGDCVWGSPFPDEEQRCYHRLRIVRFHWPAMDQDTFRLINELPLASFMFRRDIPVVFENLDLPVYPQRNAG